jgi:2-amino-4-hydroxy-6-hydroxymethyldihydropteridine diphosphokinase
MSQFCESRNGDTLRASAVVLIAIGSNLPGPDGRMPLDTCRHAVARLDGVPGLRLCGLSRWYRSAPVPPPVTPGTQPDYINAVAACVVEAGRIIDPARLLADLLAIETACGRQRGEVNAARTLDLDIIGIGGLIRSAPDPILPHPRAHQRAFVLAPLADVAPDWVHPVLGLTAAAMLAALPPQTIHVL